MWLDFAKTWQLCMVMWPNGTICPGLNWNIKKVLTPNMVDQIERYEKFSDKASEIFSMQKWTTGM